MAAPLTLVEGEIEPQLLPLQPLPESVQLTPRFEVSLVRVAMKVAVVLICTVVAEGATVTAMAPLDPLFQAGAVAIAKAADREETCGDQRGHTRAPFREKASPAQRRRIRPRIHLLSTHRYLPHLR